LAAAMGVVFTPHRRWVGQRAADRVASRSRAVGMELAVRGVEALSTFDCEPSWTSENFETM
jgi:hypothetical protein